MADEITAALIGVIGTLLGTLVGAKIYKHASLDLLQKQAQSEFSSTFSETLSELYNGHKQDNGFAVDLLTKYFPVHYAAYQKLRLVLIEPERGKLEKRWDSYTGDSKCALPEEREIYRFSDLLDIKTVHEQNMKAISRINRLLHDA